MPNRVIKESICTSESIDQLTAFQETVFYRLIVNCDDFGRMDARPKVLSSRLFPLKDIRAQQIEEALRAFASAELVILYEVDGKPFLQMKTWDKHQQIRAKRSKYPAPGGYDSTCNQMISDDSKCSRNPIQSTPIRETFNKELQEDARAREEIRSYQHSEIGTLVSTCLKAMTPKSWEDLRAFLEEMSEDLVAWAVQDACEHGGNTWAYVKKVLCSLQEAGITTVEEAEARNAKHRASKGSSRGGVKPHVNQAMELLKAGAFDDVG